MQGCPRLICVSSTTETVYKISHCFYIIFQPVTSCVFQRNQKSACNTLYSQSEQLHSLRFRAHVVAELNNLLSRGQQLRYLKHHHTRVTTATLLLPSPWYDVSRQKDTTTTTPIHYRHPGFRTYSTQTSSQYYVNDHMVTTTHVSQVHLRQS